MSKDNRRFILLTGGKGGNGNQHYATSKMQAPKYAQPGQPAKEIEILLELKLIADVGLLGFPSVGKSSFLSMISNARPEIADYHFTTIDPNLGVVKTEYGDSFVLADIPGIIEGASEGVGLGIQFLRHIERTRMLVHVVDMSGVEGRDPYEDYLKINAELKKYGKEVSKLKQIIVANKCDIVGAEGYVFTTKTGEISVHVTAIKLLSKSLQVLPEKYHGLKDTDTRYRKRYIDLIMNQDGTENLEASRRVEVLLYASDAMIKAAEAGTLK